MDKQLLNFLNYETNVVRGEFIIGRERSGGADYMLISTPDSDKPLFCWWHRKKRKGGIKLEVTEVGEPVIKKTIPKGTGGKMAYVMLMVGEVEKIQNISIEAKGAMWSFIECIEWGTGRLYRKRDKKSMTIKMMMNLFGMGVRKTEGIVKELVGNGIMQYNYKERAYFLNRKFVRKGVSVDEDKV